MTHHRVSQAAREAADLLPCLNVECTSETTVVVLRVPTGRDREDAWQAHAKCWGCDMQGPKTAGYVGDAGEVRARLEAVEMWNTLQRVDLAAFEAEIREECASACAALVDLKNAACMVLVGLNQRIKQAPPEAVPVFYGQAELWEAVCAADAAIRALSRTSEEEPDHIGGLDEARAGMFEG